jgi:hypothetical protein
MTAPENQQVTRSDLAEQLTWELLDDRISKTGMRQLEELLQADADCRRCYLACLELHQMLAEYFQASAGEEHSSPRAPMMGVTINQLRDNRSAASLG